MPLNGSGPISLAGTTVGQSIALELGLGATTTISLNQADVRTLAGVPSGAIIMPTNFYGKANQFSFSIAANQTNANLRTLAVNAGWNQASKVIATINSGVFISANSTGTPALTINGSWPGGVELINNGTIAGMGGKGGNGWSTPGATGGESGFAGGTALSVAVAVTINNAGTIAGGGGGGGTGQSAYIPPGEFASEAYGGGGGGGGRTGTTNSAGGTGGPASGGVAVSGAAGGAGTSSAAGGGGAGGRISNFGGGNGGAGGDWGAGGASGGNMNTPAFGPAINAPALGGGGAGAAITGNSNITYIATGTRLGPIS
jgi:hypothetical protein